MLVHSMLHVSPRPVALMLLLGVVLLPIRAGTEPAVREAGTLPYIRSLGSRMENTEGEGLLFSFLASELSRRSLPAAAVSIAEYAGEHSYSQILEVSIPGEGEGTLAILFPVSSENDWGDGAYGIAAALGLLDRLAENPPPINLRLAFLGADEELLGSRAYAAYLADEASLVVLRAEIGAPLNGSAELAYGGRGVLSPYWLLDTGIRTIRSQGLRDVVRANRSILHRMGLVDDPTALDPWFRKGLPAISLRVSGSESRDEAEVPDDPTEASVRLLESFLRSFTAGIPDSWDRQYVLFEAAGLRIAVRETRYIAIVLAIYALLGFLFAVDSMRRREILVEDLHKVPRGSISLVAVFTALVLCVVASRMVLEILLGVLRAPDYWRLHPVAVAVFRLLQLLSLFTSLASILARVGIIPRRAEFFRGIAVVVLGADLLIFSALRLSLSFLFLWAFLVVIGGRRLGRKTKRAWPSAIALPVSLIPLGFILEELVRKPEYTAYLGFLLPGASGIAYQCFMALPFLLLIVALGESLFGPEFYRARTALRGAVVFLAISLAGAGCALADSLAHKGMTEISLREYVDEDAGRIRLEASGLRPLPDGRLFRPGTTMDLEGGSSFAAKDLPGGERFLSLESTRESFLDRTQISLSIQAEQSPYRITVEIPQIAAGSIYDCSLPFETTERGAGITIRTGVRPPNPLTITLTVSRNFEGAARVTAQFREAPEIFETEGPVRISNHYVEHGAGILLKGRPNGVQ